MTPYRFLILSLTLIIAPALGCEGGVIDLHSAAGVTTCDGAVGSVPQVLSDLQPRAIVSDGARLLAIVANAGNHQVWSVDPCNGAGQLVATLPIDDLDHVLGVHNNVLSLRARDAMGLSGDVLRADLSDGSITSMSLGDWGAGTSGHDSFSATLLKGTGEDTVVVLLKDRTEFDLYHLLALTDDSVEHLHSERFDAGPLRLRGANAGGIYLSRDYDCGCKLGLERWTPEGGLQGVSGTTLARSLRQRDDELVILRDTSPEYQDREWELAQIPFAGGKGTTLIKLPDATRPSRMAIGKDSACWVDDEELLICHRNNNGTRRVAEAAVQGVPIIMGGAVYWLQPSDADETAYNLMVATR